LLQADTLSVASENLAEAVPVEKKKHYQCYLTRRTSRRQIIMIALFLMFVFYLYFERLMAINAVTNRQYFMSQIRDNIRNGRIDNAKEIHL
jgi:biopolymer transport protein ExbB